MVYVFLANGFEETEAIAPIDILRRSGADVKTVGVGGRRVTGSHGITITADLTEDELTGEIPEAVVLPGGMPGTLNLEASQTVQSYIDLADKNGSLICAICAAPSILGHKGLLSGKRATCFPGFEKDLTGAEITHALAETDGRFITGKGAGAAIEFGLAISAALCGQETSDRVRESLQCL